MFEGFQHIVAQLWFVVAVAALLAGAIGWLTGRATGRRLAEKSAARSAAARPVVEDPATVPAIAEVAATHERPRQYPEPPIDYVPLHAFEEPDETEDPDRTVIRMPATAGASTTPPYVPTRAAAAYSAAVAAPAPPLPNPVVTVDEVQRLRQEVRLKELEIGRIEADALSAWDRVVPRLEQQIEDLVTERDSLRRTLREAEEQSEADALSIDHLRALVAERDRTWQLRAPG